jgi:pimeloyl-ACP methyl ester carboxylesterase
VNTSTSTDSDQGAYAQVNDLNMYYEIHGGGYPVILLHGGLETCQMWSPVIASFSRDYQVITPDSRGHGRTDNPSGNFSYPLMAEDIAQLIKTLRLNRPFVTGYSDGGQTALYMAINYPGLARGYMIGATELSMTDEWRQIMQGLLGFEGPGIVDFERIAQANPEFVKSLQEKHDIFHTPGYWKTLLTQVSTQWMVPLNYIHEDFAKIVEPVLFWCGDRDVLCPPEQSLEMYRMVKEAELAIVPNADHFSMMQQIELAIEILNNFMKRVIAAD